MIETRHNAGMAESSYLTCKFQGRDRKRPSLACAFEASKPTLTDTVPPKCTLHQIQQDHSS